MASTMRTARRSDIFSQITITQNISGKGFNLFVERFKGEPGRNLAGRTEIYVNGLRKTMDGITDVNIQKGRAFLYVEAGSEAEQLLLKETKNPTPPRIIVLEDRPLPV